jgi:hypothetical protein
VQLNNSPDRKEKKQRKKLLTLKSKAIKMSASIAELVPHGSPVSAGRNDP